MHRPPSRPGGAGPHPVRPTRARPPFLWALGIALVGGLGVLFALWYRDAPDPAELPPPMVDAPAAVRTWKSAARKVEEDRGKPVGRAAAVDVPAELRHYTDRRRFLAIQVAATEEQDLDLPHDYAELARMIRREKLVEVPALGDHYILYGVGGSAGDEPFTHYDRATGTQVPLYDGWSDFKDEADDMAAQVARLRDEAREKRKALARTPRLRRNASRRRTLLNQAKGAEAAARVLEVRRQRLASFYENYEKRRLVVGEYRLLADLARAFEGRSYDLTRRRDRLRFKGRLLSFLRPEARDLLLEIARDYAERFDRPLPVTSLVRTLGYQRWLGRTNRNATQIEVPPHASGLAFDVFHGRMPAPEQEHLMRTVARLERAGRLEALRENNDHIHIFTLPAGRPSEALIARSAAETVPARPARVEPPKPRSARRPAARPPVKRPAAPKPARPAAPSGPRRKPGRR